MSLLTAAVPEFLGSLAAAITLAAGARVFRAVRYRRRCNTWRDTRSCTPSAQRAASDDHSNT